MMRSPTLILIMVLTASNAAAQGEATEGEYESDELRHSVGDSSVFLQAVRDTGLTLHDVRKIIDHFGCFEQMPDRSGVNPFTNEPLVLTGEGKAVYVEQGEVKGNFSLEDGRILFTGVPMDIAKDAAALVSAKIRVWDHD